MIGLAREVGRGRKRAAYDFVSFRCQIDFVAAGVAGDNRKLGAEGFFKHARDVMAAGAGPGGAALGSLRRFAHVLNRLERRVGAHV